MIEDSEIIEESEEIKEYMIDKFIIKNGRSLLKNKDINTRTKRLIERRIFFIKRKIGQNFRYAVKIGKIKKPNHCSRCNLFCSPGKLFGHHDDYNKPFEVRWLCSHCHELIHYRNPRFL